MEAVVSILWKNSHTLMGEKLDTALQGVPQAGFVKRRGHGT